MRGSVVAVFGMSAVNASFTASALDTSDMCGNVNCKEAGILSLLPLETPLGQMQRDGIQTALNIINQEQNLLPGYVLRQYDFDSKNSYDAVNVAYALATNGEERGKFVQSITGDDMGEEVSSQIGDDLRMVNVALGTRTLGANLNSVKINYNINGVCRVLPSLMSTLGLDGIVITQNGNSFSGEGFGVFDECKTYLPHSGNESVGITYTSDAHLSSSPRDESSGYYVWEKEWTDKVKTIKHKAIFHMVPHRALCALYHYGMEDITVISKNDADCPLGSDDCTETSSNWPEAVDCTASEIQESLEKNHVFMYSQSEYYHERPTAFSMTCASGDLNGLLNHVDSVSSDIEMRKVFINAFDSVCVIADSLRTLLFTEQHSLEEIMEPESSVFDAYVHALRTVDVSGLSGRVKMNDQFVRDWGNGWELEFTYSDASEPNVRSTGGSLTTWNNVPSFISNWEPELPLCQPGSVLQKTICVPCTAGQYWVPSTEGTGYGKCALCAAGEYNDIAGQVQCKQCSPGSFYEQLGGTLCTPCSAGHYQSKPRQSECIPCPAGRFSDVVGKSECDYCGVGTYSSLVRASSCQTCGTGMTTASTGSQGDNQCFCRSGFYRPDGTIDCISCPIGFNCEGGVLEESCLSSYNSTCIHIQPILFPGLMSVSSEKYKAYKCTGSGESCLGGEAGDGMCLEGSFGPACSECEKSWFWDGNKCEKCKEKAALTNAIYIGIGCSALVAFLWIMLLPKSNKAETGINMAVQISACSFTFAMVMNMLQLMGVYGNIGNQWPPALKKWLEGPNNLFDLSFLKYPCISEEADMRDSATIHTLVSNLRPGVFLATLLVMIQGGLLLKSWGYKKRIPSAFEGFNFALTMFEAFSVSILNNAINTAFSAIEHPDKSESLYKYPFIEQSSDDSHYVMIQSVCICAIILWVGGYLTYVAGLVFIDSKQTLRQSIVYRRRTLSRYFRFNDCRAWWSLVLLFTKIMLVISPAIHVETAFKLTHIVTVMMISFLITGISRPYRFTIVGLFDLFLNFCQTMVLVISLALVKNKGHSVYTDLMSDVVILLYTVSAAVVIYTIYAFFMYYSKTVHVLRKPVKIPHTMTWLKIESISYLNDTGRFQFPNSSGVKKAHDMIQRLPLSGRDVENLEIISRVFMPRSLYGISENANSVEGNQSRKSLISRLSIPSENPTVGLQPQVDGLSTIFSQRHLDAELLQMKQTMSIDTVDGEMGDYRKSSMKLQ